MLETVPNPHPGQLYAVRFTCPEFTSLCPITGPARFRASRDRLRAGGGDRREQVAEAVSRLVPQSRRVSRGLHARRSPSGWSRRCGRAGCASAATGIRAAASRSTCSIRPASRPPGCGCPTRAWRPIAAGGERRHEPTDDPRGDPRPRRWRWASTRSASPPRASRRSRRGRISREYLAPRLSRRHGLAGRARRRGAATRRALWPEARSVVVLGVNYGAGGRPAGRCGRSRARRRSRSMPAAATITTRSRSASRRWRAGSRRAGRAS